MIFLLRLCLAVTLVFCLARSLLANDASLCDPYINELKSSHKRTQDKLQSFVKMFKKIENSALKPRLSNEWCKKTSDLMASNNILRRGWEDSLKSYQDKFDSLTKSNAFKTQCSGQYKVGDQQVRPSRRSEKYSAIMPKNLYLFVDQISKSELKLSQMREKKCHARN